MTNFILKTDSYKASHFLQLPPKTNFLSAYVEPRADKTGHDITEIVTAGLQPFLKDLSAVRVTKDDVDEAEELLLGHGEPFNRDGWMRIVNDFNGKIPVIIQGYPDGTLLPIGTPQAQVVNSIPKMSWLTTYIETQLLRSIWYPSTVATLSRECKKVIMSYLKRTCDDPEGQIMFKLHDFGARGVSSGESAAIGGVAHLFNFMGTDTVESIVYARKYYNTRMAAFSIPAAEHSTITSWGPNNEVPAYENMIDKFGGLGKIFAVVSDSYDIFNAVENIWGGVLKDKVINNGGTLVIRPDSGDPASVIMRILHILDNVFGHKINSKGFKVLPSYLRIIQGDGVNIKSIDDILFRLEVDGWSAENIAFGMGGALLQQVNRDNFSYAMKCNAVSEDGIHWTPVQKKPITDGGKASKAGRIENMKVMYDDIIGCRLNDNLDTIRERCKVA